jgi:DNA-binding transcriptional LysR family regulator
MPLISALYDFIAPFFGRLSEVEDIVKGKLSRVIKLAGFSEAMREHGPVLLAKLRERFPGLKVTLQEIDQRGAEQLIAQGDADLAIMVLESKLPPGFPLRDLGPPSALSARESRSTVSTRGRLVEGRCGREGNAH